MPLPPFCGIALDKYANMIAVLPINGTSLAFSPFWGLWSVLELCPYYCHILARQPLKICSHLFVDVNSLVMTPHVIWFLEGDAPLWGALLGASPLG